MAHPIAPDYGQQFLFPPALEDFVPADHPARFLREFVDQLDLARLGFELPTGDAGRPPYATGLLLKIWLYGYLHRIRSTRKLEVACKEHLSLIWLTGMITPDHNSLWRFWRDNQKALRQVFKQTVQVAVRTGCVGLALQALDGTKIEAAASGYSGWSKEYMEKLLAELDKVLAETELKIVQENAGPAPGYQLPAGLTERKALREQIKTGLDQLAADERKHYHPVEPEARRMKVGTTNRYAYNAQVVVDEKEGVIVACENTRHENDIGQLTPLIEQARENVGIAAQETTTLADSGYGTGPDLKAAQDQGLDVLTQLREDAQDNPYALRHFKYDPAHQTVTCPRGEQLDHTGRTTKNGSPVERYRCHCKDCPVRGQCTQDRKGRLIEIWPHHPAVEQMRQKLKDPVLAQRLQRRGQIVERCFAQIKQHDGFRRWTVWGWEGVKTQWAMLCTAVNLRIILRRWQSERKTEAAEALAAWKIASLGTFHSIPHLLSRWWLPILAGRTGSRANCHLSVPLLNQ